MASRIKFNGYRVQFHLENGHKKAYTRNGLDWTKRFSAIAGDIPGQAIVDCEVVVIREGLRVSLFSGGAGGTPPGCYVVTGGPPFACVKGPSWSRIMANTSRPEGDITPSSDNHGSGVALIPSNLPVVKWR